LDIDIIYWVLDIGYWMLDIGYLVCDMDIGDWGLESMC